MSELTGTRVYDLLPTVYRVRDADQDQALRALLSVVERELQLVEADVARLYDNWFIETCDEWVVPYIGDLLGVRGLASIEAGTTFTQRALVANTIGYRRRKGTAAVLEQLARDVTGWPAHAVEYFQLLEWTQHANHIRPQNVRTPDLRDSARLALLDGPFESAAHTVDVRHIDRGRGKYNIANVGLFLWRLQDYAVSLGTARPVATPPDGRYRFDPLGRDVPLYNKPRTETEITHLSEEENVPDVLRRRALYDELEARRQALVDGQGIQAVYFRDDRPGPVIEITVDDDTTHIPPEFVLICNLEDWRRPPKTRAYRQSASPHHSRNRRIRVAVDPVLGRITFPQGVAHGRVRVSYAYGFAGDVGGGPYDRRASLMSALQSAGIDPRHLSIDWQLGVSRSEPAAPGTVVPTLGQAVRAWNSAPKQEGTVGLILVMDSATYRQNLTGALRTIVVPDGTTLLLVAGTWPKVPDPAAPGATTRTVGQYVPDGLRPHIEGNVSVRSEGGPGEVATGRLIVDGFLIEGRLSVLAGSLGNLVVSNCTVVPGEGGVRAQAGAAPDQQNSHLSVHVARSICGAVRFAPSISGLSIVDSIVDGTRDGPGPAIDAAGAEADIQATTVLGSSNARTLDAGNSIFRDLVTVARRQTGCVRFCYLPLESQTPRRYRCQPTDQESAERVFPQFTSLVLGDPGFGQLATGCPEEITRGAEDEDEMGTFHFLQQRRRIGNLVANLDQYLRFGLEAGIFLAT